MKKHIWVIVFTLLLAKGNFAQEENISFDKHIHFRLERYVGSKSSLVKQGDSFTVYAFSGDTLLQYSGDFYAFDGDSLSLVCYSLYTYFEGQDHTYEETKNFTNNRLIQISTENIDYLERLNPGVEIGTGIASLGLTTAMFAPLFCINKNYDYRFNVKRYIDILKVSAIAVAGGAITAGILSSNRKHKLKPKLVTPY